MDISSISNYSNATYAADRVPIQTLGQADFLKLLVTQMTSQDPLNPQKDTDFIAQMAQFSALEQSKTMQQDIALLRSQQELLQASSLLGQTVEIQVNSEIRTIGVISAVRIEAGTPKIVVGENSYNLSQVLTIAPTLPEP
jgi:flagellar basal-body rod modification protein FlgD